MNELNKHQRLGKKFLERINVIKIERIKSGSDMFEKPISVEKITNLIVRHKGWNEIELEIISANEEEVRKFGDGK